MERTFQRTKDHEIDPFPASSQHSKTYYLASKRHSREKRVKCMKVSVYYSREDIRIEEKPIPDIGENEALIQTKACGVCVADTMEWYLKSKAPLTLGHEPTGVVTRIGKQVKNLKEGDRVVVHHHVPCLICRECRRGNFTMCTTFKKTNIYPGGFSEYFVVSPLHIERDVLLLPEHVSFEAGTLVEPLACVIHAIKKAKISSEDSVILIGTGVMGLMFIQTLLFLGVRKLVVYELDEWRKEMAVSFGAQHVFSPFRDTEKEKERLGDLIRTNGADKVIIAAKDISAMQMGMQLVNKGGTLTFFATPHPSEAIDLYPSYLFFNEITLTSSYSADHLDTRDALEMISHGDINAQRLITHSYPLEELGNAIEQTANRGKSLKNIIVFK